MATVSRALRGLPNVAASTRRRVAEVAEELDYQPDPAASRLAAGRTRTVIVVVPNLSGWYFSSVVAGAEAVCTEAGYDFLVLGVSSQSELRRLLDERTHLERRADGIVLVDIPVSHAQADSLRHRGMSLATIGANTEGHPAIVLDNEAIGSLAAEHLIGLGHRCLAVIGGQRDDPMNFEVPKQRFRGFLRACHSAGIELDRSQLAGGNFGIDGGYEAMLQLLADGDPTGVFAMSDEMAFGAMMALRERGLEPGRDVSVLGVDDHEFARVVELTTIRQHVPEHGAAAARALIAAMTGDERAHAGEATATSFELVIRSTTAAPAPART